MGGGALMQLIASGAQDIHLTGNPQMTHFKMVYKRHTNFAIESIVQDTVGNITQGSRFSVTIGRHGDLLSNITLGINLKTFKVDPLELSSGGFYASCLSGCSGEDLNLYYPSPGYNLIDFVEIEIGGVTIDKHYGDWLNIWTDLTEPLDKKLMLNQLLYGKYGYINSLSSDIMTNGEIYLPLKFWFCKQPGLALPLISLQYHEVKLHFHLKANISETQTLKLDIGSCDISGNITIPKIDNIIDELNVYAEYIYLDTDERRKFAQMSHEYLIEQTQTLGPLSIQNNTTRIPVNIRFNHPIKELFWIIENSKVENGITKNRKFEIIDKASIQLNGKDLFHERTGTYFTLLQRYKYHSGTPIKYLFEAMFSGDSKAFERNYSKFTGSPIPSEAIHTYSFGVAPEKCEPTGTCNFSRLDNVVLQLKFFNKTNNKVGIKPCYNLSTTPEHRTLWLFGINYNILKIMGGMGGLAYSN
tara:strand:- start:493 stop:1905 length:1413 start_codon:yes stop_codon:yes gene_type:complete